MARQLIRTDHHVEAIRYYVTYGEGRYSPWQTTTVPELNAIDLASADSHATNETRPGNHQDHIKVLKAKTGNNDLFNGRTVSLISAEQMEGLAVDMELPVEAIENNECGPITEFLMRMLGANVLLRGEDGMFNLLVPGTQIFFGDDNQPLQGAITLEGYINPCKKPALQLWHTLGSMGLGPLAEFEDFKDRLKIALAERRGWAGWLSTPLAIQIGQTATLHQPNLPPSRSS